MAGGASPGGEDSKNGWNQCQITVPCEGNQGSVGLPLEAYRVPMRLEPKGEKRGKEKGQVETKPKAPNTSPMIGQVGTPPTHSPSKGGRAGEPVF